ncbi:2Fe-2S iron-sulfur cluster-binding protein [Streptomyces djakartensis]|uniref:2Fe-2S iron-sulfur cluster-binding protein n=1 Tax=Streptomyces djakartensis TaxID=68193 RepID=UPI00167D383C|nr:2Fe-2S iron-sulfur cluster-binding protein [Streptomyces djakartensis]
MTDDQHGEGTPRSGGRWDPLPQGEYDDGATAFVELPEGGVDALLAADSPLAAPGHGYVPPQIAVDPAMTAGTDPAAMGWPAPGAPADGTQWHDPHAAHQQGHEHGGHQQGHGVGEQPYEAPYGTGNPYDTGTPYGPGAGQHGGDDRFTYNPGTTGQWSFEEAAAAETAPGHDVTGQWSIPVAGGDLPDESGEFTTSSLVEQWGGTPPPTLPGGAPAPWATHAAGRPWGEQDPAAQEQAAPAYSHEHGHEHGRQDAAGPASGYAPEQPPAALPQQTDQTGQTDRAPGEAPAVPEGTGHAAGTHDDGGHGPQPYEETGHAPESSAFAGHGPEMPDAEHTHRPSGEAGRAPGEHGAEASGFTGHGSESVPFAEGGPEHSGFTGHGSEPSGEAGRAPEAEASRFTGHGSESVPFAEGGPEHSGFVGHGSEPSVEPGRGTEPSGDSGHGQELSGPAGDPAEPSDRAAHAHPEPERPAAASSPQPYPEAPGEFPGVPAHEAPEAAEDTTGRPEQAQEASQPAPGAGEATEDAPEAVDAADNADAAEGPVQPEAGALPALADTDAGPEAAGAGPTNAPAPEDQQATGHDATGTPHDRAGHDHDTPPAMPREEHPLASYVLRVNDTERPVTDAWIGESLLYVLRERLGLAGAKDGCSQGECGACNVQVDGRLVASCLVPAVTAAGSEVRTVEGLAEDGQPSDVQRALARCGAVQCGFCVPGMAMTVHDLLEGNPAPTELETRQALCGNLCRCTGYRGVVDAVKEVVAEREAHAAPADGDTGEPRIPHQAGPGAGGVNPSAFGSPPETPSAEAHSQGPHAPEAHSPDPHDQSYGQDGGPA